MTEQKQFIAKEDTITKINRELSNQVHNDLVYVYIYLRPNSLIDVINPFVWQIVNKDDSYNLAVALVEVKKLETLASLEQVRTIRTVMPPIVRSGSVVTEGDAIHQTDEVRNLYSQSGDGIKVGVISDGVDNLASAQSSGDLPSVTVLDNSDGGDEGTAMLEIIHDMAPDAELYFHTGFPNYIVFNNAVDDLVAAGCNVIVDDLGFLDQPYFEDGYIATNVATTLVDHNIVYVSAAGNAAQEHYQGIFNDNGSGWHDFSAGLDQILVAYVPNGDRVTSFLQWNDSFGSSGNDYDLYLVNQGSGNYEILDASEIEQNGNDDPLEWINYTNTSGSTIIVGIYIKKYSGLDKTLEINFNNRGGVEISQTFVTVADSIFGHPAVPGVIAVGAIDASDPGNDDIEDFSSQGPVTIIGEDLRAKPDVIGIDGVSITGAGGFSNPFFGTSAAAPHIAAIAAQLWGKFSSNTADEIRGQILDNSVDLGTAGFDNIYGYGRADALASLLNSLIAPVLAEVTPVTTPTNDTTPDYTFSSTEIGTIAYGGSCTSTATNAIADNNPITFSTLTEGTYNDCTITVTDATSNASNTLSVTSFTIDTTVPTSSITYSIDHAVKDADTLVITAVFSEVMKDSPVPQIAITYDGGIDNLTATDMTKTDTTHYFYNLDVPAGDGTGTITLSTGTDLAGNVITSIPSSGATFTVDNTVPDNQDTVFDTSASEQGGESVGIESSGDEDNNVWFAPLGTTSFVAGDTMTTAGGTATTISAPADEGSYRLFVIDIAGNYSSPSTAVLTVDDTGSTIAEVIPVTTPANDTTPDYTFSSTEAGTISYGGSCTSTATNAIADDNPITFSTLAEGTYSDCTITVTDTANNVSNTLSVTSFTIDTTVPIAYLTGPVDGDRTELVIRFNDALDADTLAMSNRAILLNSISNDVTGTSTPISVASEVGSVIWDNSDIDAPVATVSIPSTTFVEDQTVRINFIETAVKDLAENAILNATNVDVVVLASTQIAATPTVTVNTTQTEVVISSPHNTSITVPSTVTNATIDINSLTTDSGSNITATLPGIALSVTTDTFATPIEVAIPTDIVITGPTEWNSIINVPQIESNSSVTATPDSGYTSTVSSVIEIGYSDTELTFDKAVRLLIPDAAGKYVGYSRNGVFTKITTVCSADTQVAGDVLSAGGNCKRDVGSDLVIWTKHFTKFASYTQTVIQGGGGGGGGGGGAPAAPTSVSASNTSLSVLTTQTGTLTQTFSDNTVIKVEIPKGALNRTTTFSVVQGNLTGGLKPVDTMGAILIGDTIFNVNATDSINRAVTNFSSNLTMTFTIPDLSNVSNLGVYYFDRTLDQWVSIPGASFDPVNNKVSFDIDHLTRFAVFQIAGLPETIGTEEGLIVEDSFWTLGRWVKKESITAVYFLDSSNVLHTYPNQSIWESYFGDDFSFVETITEEELNGYTLGVNVPYSSGSLFKMQAFPKVYMVGDNGLIQWIKTEEKATELYGENWADLVHDLSTAFFMDYTRGDDIE